jgi:MFS transporter, ACS family, D-galactonate transporter
MIALAHFNRISITVAGAEKIIPEQNIDPTQMGLVYSSYLFIYTLAMSPGGWFSDRFGPRLALFVVGAGSALFLALTGMAGMLWTGSQLLLGLIVIRGLMGFVNAPTHPAGAQFVGQWIPAPQRNLVNGLIGFAACIGISLTYYVFGMLMDQFEWPNAFMIVAVVTLIVALVWAGGSQVIALLVPGSPPPPSSVPSYSWEDTAIRIHKAALPPLPSAEPSYSWSLLLRNRSLLLLTLSYAAVNYFQYMFFYWSEYYFKVRGLDKDDSRLYSSILTLTMGFGMASGGWLTDWVRQRFRHRRGLVLVPVGGLLIGAGALVPGSLSDNPEVTLLCIAIAMWGVGASEGAFWTTAVCLGGARGGLAAGILNTGGNAGGMLAPVVTPFISARYSWLAGFGLASTVCILGALCWAGIDPDNRREAEG